MLLNAVETDNTVLGSDNHIEQILSCQFVAHIRTLKKGIGKRTFSLMQAENLLLNCIFCNQVIYGHFLFLSNAICPVSGLLFYGRIPPRVKVNHLIRTRQVKSQTTRFERNKENSLMPLLELLDHFGTVPQRSRTVQIEIIMDSGCLHFRNCHIQE